MKKKENNKDKKFSFDARNLFEFFCLKLERFVDLN